MIQINLLGVPKPKKGKRGGGGGGAVAMPSGEGINPVVLIVIGLLIGGGLWYGMYWRVSSESARIATEMKKAQAEAAELASAKAAYEEKEKQLNTYQQRVKVIDDLRKAQSGPVDLLQEVSNTVGATDAVWLNKMVEDPNKVDLDGNALSAHAVANLIASLRDSGYFQAVELKETIQDEKVKDLQQFNFTITCEKKRGQ
jgi:Tfp pilus assembly protein PilN